MNTFGTRSKSALSTIDPDLYAILHDALEVYDFSVLCGYRGKDKQDEYFETGRSKKQFPDSVHNKAPSLAVDVAPWPIDWNDSLAFARLYGIIEAFAHIRGFKTRWGGDWDSDGGSRDQSFMDIGHIELVKE